MQSYGVIEPFVVAIPATSQGTVPSRGEGLDLGVRFALPHVVGLPRYLAINVQDHASAAADRLTEINAVALSTPSGLPTPLPRRKA